MTGKGEILIPWQTGTMARMLLLSMAFHGVVGMLLFLTPLPSRPILSLTPVYQVDLVTLPSPPEVRSEAEVQMPEPHDLVTLPSPPEVRSEAEVQMPEPQVIPAPPQSPPKAPPEAEKPKVVAEKPKVVETRLPEPRQARLALTPTKKTEPEPMMPSREGASRPPGATAAVPSVTVGVEVPDFKFPFYLKLIQGKIGSMWSPPAIEMGSGSKEVVIYFVLSKTGKIEKIQVERSSGNSFFDQAALRAVYMADPLPPFPTGLSESELKVHFSFILTGKG